MGADTEEESAASIFDSPQATQGISTDAGLSVLVSKEMGLIVSVVGRNLRESHFEPITETSVQEKDRMDLDTGFSFAPTFRKTAVSPSLSLEMHHILRNDLDIENKLKIGAEIGFAKLFKNSALSLRGGYDMSAPSAGISLDLLLFSIELAAYNHLVNIGDHTKRNETRYLLRTSWDLQK